MRGVVAMFDGFEEFDISSDGASVHGVRDGGVVPVGADYDRAEHAFDGGGKCG